MTRLPPSCGLFGLACTVLLGCAGLPLTPSTPVEPTRPAGVASQAARQFTLEPGDMISVEATSLPPLRHDGLIVDGQGRVHVPGIGDLSVGGQTTAVAEQRIEMALRRMDTLGKVFVSVTDARGHRMTILGAVAEQGTIAIVPGMRLAEAYAAAGGAAEPVLGASGQPIEIPDIAGASLVRDGERMPIDLSRAVAGDPRHNVRVLPRDHLFVPWREGVISVFGQVETPTVMRHREGLRMTEAIALAGGVTTGGDKSDIRLIRGPLEEPLVYRIDLAAIVSADRPDVELSPGDVLFVTDDPLEDAGEVLTIIGPTLGLVLSVAVLSLTL